jgi:antitoxin ParD1/3/4
LVRRAGSSIFTGVSIEAEDPMPARSVKLTARHEAVIEDLVRSGRYESADEVVSEGLRLIERREAEDAARLEALREAARLGFEDLDQGRYREFGEDDDFAEYIAERVRIARQKLP